MGSYKANELGRMLADLKKQTERAMADDISRAIYSTIQKFLLEEIYSKFKPSEYQRTYELLNSLKVSPIMSNGKNISIKIYFPNEIFKDDKHKMRYTIGDMSLTVGDMPTVTEVLQILEEGLNRSRPDAQVMDKAIEELKSTQIILKRLMGYLRSKGYNIQ